MNTFSVENHFKRYMSIVYKKHMPPQNSIPYTELKRAYYAGFGDSFITARDRIAPCSNEEALLILKDVLREVSEFWNEESACEK